MPSLLSYSNNSSKSEELNLKDIEVLVDNKGRNCFNRAHIRRYLGIAPIVTSTTKLSEEDIRPWVFL